jgi:hypothetical protein
LTDIWVCGNCQSINRQRNKKCYKCGADQEKAATGDMATHRQEQAIATRTVVKFRSSSALGFATAVLLLVMAGVTVAKIPAMFDVYQFTNDQLDVVASTGSPARAASIALIESVGPILILSIVVPILTLLFFASWLSRVVANVPALGGGVPNTSPAQAFISTLIPIVNLKTVPGTVQDVMYRLDPKAGGLFMLGLAWVGIVGSFIVSFIAGWYLDLRMRFDTQGAESISDFVATLRGLLWPALLIDIATTAMIAIGSVILILIVVRIERRSRDRDAEIRAVAGV